MLLGCRVQGLGLSFFRSKCSRATWVSPIEATRLFHNLKILTGSPWLQEEHKSLSQPLSLHPKLQSQTVLQKRIHNHHANIEVWALWLLLSCGEVALTRPIVMCSTCIYWAKAHMGPAIGRYITMHECNQQARNSQRV